MAWSTVFALADTDAPGAQIDVTGVVPTTLLLLGVPDARAQALAAR